MFLLKKSSGRIWTAAVLGLGLLFLPVEGQAKDEVRYLVLGDSLSDSGNLYTLTSGYYPPSCYWKGRFSNGPVWSEQFVGVENLGLVTGEDGFEKPNINFAFAGTTTGAVTPLPGVLNQAITLERAIEEGEFTVRDSDIAAIWAGANDYFATLENLKDKLVDNPEGALLKTTLEAIENIRKTLARLEAVGINQAFILNMPNFGRVPEFNTDPVASELSNVAARMFNEKMDLMAKEFKIAYPDFDLLVIDIYSIFNDILDNHADYGFENVTEACMPIMWKTCSHDKAVQNSFFFYDMKHPTEHGHQIIAGIVHDAVDEEGLEQRALMKGREPGAVKRRLERSRTTARPLFFN